MYTSFTIIFSNYLGGKLINFNALKIQKSWRGYEGRKIAVKLFLIKLGKKANIIRNLFLRWKQRKLKLMNYTIFINQITTRIQKMYRLRILNKIMQAIRMKRRINKTIIFNFNNFILILSL